MVLDKLVSRFQSVDRATRLEALLEAAKRLPAIPQRLVADRDREAHRITECQTPVFLWFEREGDCARLYADVPRESPTVRGFVALLVKHLDGAPIGALRDLPGDLLSLMKLDEALGMMRTQGLTAIVRRVRQAGGDLAADGVRPSAGA